MKIRNGFVSNSSSSSFCIYGASLEFDELVEKLKETDIISEEKLNEIIDNEYDEQEEEILNIIDDNSNLEVYQYDDDVWIGRSWSSIADDETGGEFKESIKAELEKLLGPNLDLYTYSEEIYG